MTATKSISCIPVLRSLILVLMFSWRSHLLLSLSWWSFECGQLLLGWWPWQSKCIWAYLHHLSLQLFWFSLLNLMHIGIRSSENLKGNQLLLLWTLNWSRLWACSQSLELWSSLEHNLHLGIALARLASVSLYKLKSMTPYSKDFALSSRLW